MLFGFPQRVACQFRKTIEIKGADYIDDTYNLLLGYRTFLASLTVESVATVMPTCHRGEPRRAGEHCLDR